MAESHIYFNPRAPPRALASSISQCVLKGQLIKYVHPYKKSQTKLTDVPINYNKSKRKKTLRSGAIKHL